MRSSVCVCVSYGQASKQAVMKTGRQTDWQLGKHEISRQVGSQTDRQEGNYAGRRVFRQVGKQTVRKVVMQVGGYLGWQTDRQEGSYTGRRVLRQAGKQTGRKAVMQAGGYLERLANRQAGRVQELCESRGGHPGLFVLTSLMVSVDVKQYRTMLTHWYQLVPNMSTDIRGH